jgi:hypothetical protein
MPAIARHQTLRELMAESRQAIGPADVPFFHRTFDYGAVFYSRGHIPTHEGDLPNDGPRFVLMSSSEWERLRPRIVNRYEQVPLPSGPRRLVLLRRTDDGTMGIDDPKS